jgi:hypothetical protein
VIDDCAQVADVDQAECAEPGGPGTVSHKDEYWLPLPFFHSSTHIIGCDTALVIDQLRSELTLGNGAVLL